MPALLETPTPSATETISFGTLFRVVPTPQAPDKIAVITNVGDNDWFESNAVVEDDQGYKFTGLLGDGGPEVFHSTIGQLTPEQVLKAAQGGAILGQPLSPSQIHYLETNAQKPPRLLELNK